MFLFTVKKLLAKRWMFFCMLLGCVLLIATTICLPLYENAVFDKMLQDQFQLEYENTGLWPAKYFKKFQSKKNTGAAELHARETLLSSLESELGVTTKESVRFYKTVNRQLSSTMERDDDNAHENIQISMLSDLDGHIELLAGEMYSEDGYSEEGYLEVVLTRNALVDYGYLLGEVLVFKNFKGLDGSPLKIEIVGVVSPKDDDFYWEVETESDLDDACYISEDAFRALFLGDDDNYLITGYHCYLFEYENLNAENVKNLLRFAEEETIEVCPFGTILETYEAKRIRISATLRILQIPMVLLLGSFLIMLSKQMFEVESNEIAVMKSRGSSKGQLFLLYFYQNIILVLLGLLVGIPLGIGMMQLLGSASGFFEFAVRRKLAVIINGYVYVHLLVAVVFIVGVLSIPAVNKSRLSIVNVKQGRVKKKRPFWERYYLDIICMVVSGYGYYHFLREKERLAEYVIVSKPLNPIMYISSALLTIGLGLLFLRLLPLIVKVIYKLGEKGWKPATYAAFVEIMRSSSRQHFILLFLVLSMAFGIYHATVAQTIMDNAVKNAEYLMPVDVIVAEHWDDNMADTMVEVSLNPNMKLDTTLFRLYEPESFKYRTIPGIKNYTKVYMDDISEETADVTVTVGVTKVNMMLIHSKKFGEMTWMDGELTDEHYYTYLNKLVDDETGFIVSRNLANYLKCQVGSAISVIYKLDLMDYGDMGIQFASPREDIIEAEQKITLEGRIVGIVDYWPGYVPEFLQTDDYGNVYKRANYLIVGSYIPFERKIEKEGWPQPYQVWIDLEEDVDSAVISDWLLDQDMEITKYQNKQRIMLNTIADPLLQGTCGLLTLEFTVIILLCAVGYLVHWMMSIKDRQLLFGIFRAMGMHKSEVFRILFLEQCLSGVLTFFAAIGIGKFVCKVFAPLMLITYSAAQQVVPMETVMDKVDEMRLYGSVILVFVLCIIMLIRFAFKMNVVETLKLGED